MPRATLTSSIIDRLDYDRVVRHFVRTLSVAIASIAAGCGSIATDPPVAAPPAPAVVSIAPPAPESESEPEAPLPPFLSLDREPHEDYPLRAVLERLGPTLSTADARELAAGSDALPLNPVIVLEGEEGRGEETIPILCETHFSRVAVAHHRDDFATVTLSGAVLLPNSDFERTVEPKTPGLRLAAGVVLDEIGEANDGAHRALFDHGSVKAEGFVREDRVGIVYERYHQLLPTMRNGELKGTAPLLVGPGERAFGVLRKAADGRTLVLIDGPPEEGHVLVRYGSGPVTAVGWVKESLVERRLALRYAEGGGGLALGPGAPPTVELSKGTVLSADGSASPIGIMTKAAELSCTAECAGPSPVVLVPACGVDVELRAGE